MEACPTSEVLPFSWLPEASPDLLEEVTLVAVEEAQKLGGLMGVLRTPTLGAFLELTGIGRQEDLERPPAGPGFTGGLKPLIRGAPWILLMERCGPSCSPTALGLSPGLTRICCTVDGSVHL